MNSLMEPDTENFAAASGNLGFSDARKAFDTVRLQIEERRCEQLEKLARAEEMLTKLVSSIDQSLIEVAVSVGHKTKRIRKPLADSEVVEKAIASLGGDEFLLDDLARKIDELFPGRLVDRETISRRLHDLKQKGEVVVSLRLDDGLAIKKRSHRIYRRSLSGLPPAQPPAG